MGPETNWLLAMGSVEDFVASNCMTTEDLEDLCKAIGRRWRG